MVLTPTYHVFHMYQYHQNAELAASSIEGSRMIGAEPEFMVPDVQESASVSTDGTVNITINNLSAEEEKELFISFMELKPANVEATVVTGKMETHNTFENPNAVKEESFNAFEITQDGIKAVLPPCSVVLLRVK